jgi:8-oxo-dGTP pyrophosphatase MutT (NUDIX family)
LTTLHADAVRVLSGWSAPDGATEALRTDFLAHLDAHPDGMWRSCRPAHVTASALVLDPASDQVLLTLHPKVGRWLQLGGHCETGDATLAAAALREATEESGLAGLELSPAPVALDRHDVACGGALGVHLDVQYVARARAGRDHRISAESLDLQWFDADALPAPADPALARLVNSARR